MAGRPAAKATGAREPWPASRAAPRAAPRAKIGDVARLAGVSLGTVSAVLNGKGRVSDATRERVQAAIEELGYHPDLYASNLARRETRLLGVVVSNLQNPFFAETAQAMEDEALRHGYQISLMATNFSPAQHRAAVAQLLGARIAGLAVLTSEHDQAARQRVLASGVPAVFLDVGRPAGNLSVLRVDSRGGMRAAVEHLIALGHRDLLFLRNSQKAGGPPLLSHRLRQQGFAAAIRACAVEGLQTHVLDTPGPGADAGEQAITSALHDGVRFTAAISITDTVAMGVYRGLQQHGLDVPREVSVVGFDNTFFSRFLHPPLTTVDVPRNELSRLAVEALLAGAPGELIRLETRLILRESTMPPGGKLTSPRRSPPERTRSTV